MNYLLLMRYILVLIVSFCFISCEYEKYPPENYDIPKKFRDLISSFRANDTIKFSDANGNYISLLIENIDSTLLNKRGHFINAREHKDIVVSCRELTNPRRGYESYNLILINKFPDEDSASFSIRFMDFFAATTSLSIYYKPDTVSVNKLIFTNYYLFTSNDSKRLKNSNSIAEIYITAVDGIVAFKNLNGKWWTKTK